ncbi:MAG: hypothetical protein VYC56_05255 [Actinomycetota bacterium]|nr:hypothetical protein [Actinomycetota bacterium]MEC9394381.1 hypothetical protein [Actinomycetota bacterium]MEE2957940.1 hypothetical protein [Actinomycetota bacterium]
MNPSVLFLLGAAGLAVVLSAVVWLLSRPRKPVEDPNQLRQNLRVLRQRAPGAPRPVYREDRIRVLGDEDLSHGDPAAGDQERPV